MYVCVCVYVNVYVEARLATATPVHDHAGEHAVNDVVVHVVVQHRYGGHFAGRTTRPRAELGHLHQMRVRVFLEQHWIARARTVVGHVLFRCDYPVPAELLEVDRQRVPATPRLRGRLVACQSGRYVPPGPGPPILPGVHFQVRDLTIIVPRPIELVKVLCVCTCVCIYVCVHKRAHRVYRCTLHGLWFFIRFLCLTIMLTNMRCEKIQIHPMTLTNRQPLTMLSLPYKQCLKNDWYLHSLSDCARNNQITKKLTTT